ncbi:MAG: RsmE family RNA methyltransferase [Desulfomonilaceae bacterium]|nr:RsmE family RNA methyltransferase [Desulfomonilaceae bacterium]
MRYRRIFVQSDEIVLDKIVLSDRNARYVCKVLRHRQGDVLKVLDGQREYLVRLLRCRPTEVMGEIIEMTCEDIAESGRIILAFSCVRPGPMEEILRHGTELGVTRFVPLLSRRSNRRPTARKDRWEAVVGSAAAQSGRLEVPTVDAPIPLNEFLAEEPGTGCNVLLTTSTDGAPLLRLLDESRDSRVAILVGPEGGFTPVEETEAEEAGFVRSTLGPRVLRTETAAIVAAGIVTAWQESRCGISFETRDS